ncbi:hypothetical protein OCV51_14300 [Faecalicatena acetigenes]|uniref:Uncharacterized protein n=1 Tax=Faecalicatena acetigenes TaxID=2981790 RepID=A0ABT2TET6_9FIRM|nr:MULTISPECIES: hypothetical protein [Lachnospiraceae]MCU6748802.1 hypothetical protein [Faecalicatena acetigenes]
MIYSRNRKNIKEIQRIQTSHVESVVLLSKLKSNRLKHINVELEMDELDLTVVERSSL